MGLRLVYGLNTDDLSYLQTFYPSRRLAEAALAMGLDYKAAILARDADPAAMATFCRGHTTLLRGELPASLYESLEAEGVAVVNTAAATALAKDKAACAEFFMSIGAAHPMTVVIEPSDPLPPLPCPFVLKPRYGKMGRGISLASTAGDWDAFRLSGPAADYVAQAYVESSRGRDVRFFFAAFAGNQSPVAVLRSGPGLASNSHAGGSMEPFDAPGWLRAEATRIFAASGLDYGTVDFLFADTRGTSFTVCEINACPGFEELERVTGLDVAGAILGTAMARASSPKNDRLEAQ